MRRLLRLAGHDSAGMRYRSARQLMQPLGERNRYARPESGSRSVSLLLMGFALCRWMLRRVQCVAWNGVS